MEGDPSACAICFEPYDSSPVLRLPKVTDCGHTFCLECLQKAQSICPNCRQRIPKRPEDLTTVFALISSGTSENKYCHTCKKVAVRQCQLDRHRVQNLKPYLQQKVKAPVEALKAYRAVLENVTPYMLQMQEVARDQLHEVMAEGDLCKELSKDLDKCAEEEKVEQVDRAMCQVEKYKERKHRLECGLKFGKLTILLQRRGNGDRGDGGSHVASLDLQALAAERSDVLATTQVLMYLLSKHGYLQSSRQQNVLPGVTGDGGNVRAQQDGRRKPDGPPSQQQMRGANQVRPWSVDPGAPHGPQHAARRTPLTPSPASPVQSAVEITDDGVLDLGLPSRMGVAPYGVLTPEKEALLRSERKVREIKGPLECKADPEFSRLLLQKHLSSLETVDLRKVQSVHFHLLSMMPNIKNIKVVANDGRLAEFPPQPAGRGLKSLYVHLPVMVQLSMWKGFASSVQTVTIRIEAAGVVDLHLSLKPCVDMSQRLNSIHLHRKDPNLHTKVDCDKQIDRVRQVVPDSVRVTCNICRHTDLL
ncbi:uncharacterized protein LOC113210149 [Frankliniella occidentalis]|uniref:Uncharacterized protein LOC113210149 n=1 Tax=Frankliniella occidentalis TaxID=133901 RepID=A0A9C6XQS1_FRAOC|nr:uncharacterized protein LOC113210149 [Frankliniella occidentalis]